MPGVGERDIPAVFIEREMAATPEESRDAIHLIGQHVLSGVAARDHQRNARFVDQDRVGFVDHGGCERTVHSLAWA